MLYHTLQQKVPLDTLVTFHLKSGSSVQGRLIEIGREHVLLDHASSFLTIPLSTIDYWVVSAPDCPEPIVAEANSRSMELKEQPVLATSAAHPLSPAQTDLPLDARARLQNMLLSFQRRISRSNLLIPEPCFDLSDDDLNNRSIRALWNRARNIFEYAASNRELDTKFGRVQSVATTLETAYRGSSSSVVIGRQLIYFLCKSQRLDDALDIAMQVANDKHSSSDLHTLAAVARLTGKDSIALDALFRAFLSEMIPWENDSWFVFINLVVSKNDFRKIIDLTKIREESFSFKEWVNILSSIIFILASTHRHIEASQLLQRMIEGESPSQLSREAILILSTIHQGRPNTSGRLDSVPAPPVERARAEVRLENTSSNALKIEMVSSPIIVHGENQSRPIANPGRKHHLDNLRKHAGRQFFAGSTPESLELYRQAFSISGSAIDLGQVLQCLVRLDQDEDALELARLHLERFSGKERLKILHPYGDVTRALRLHAETIKIYDEVAKLAETVGARVTAHVWTARALYYLGDIDAARAAIVRALSDAPANRFARELLRQIEAGGLPLPDDFGDERSGILTNESISAGQDFLWIDIDALPRGKAPAQTQHENRPSHRVASAIYRQGESTNQADYETRARYFGQAAKEYKEYLRLNGTLAASDQKRWEIAPARYAASCGGRHYERMITKVEQLLSKGNDPDVEGNLTRDLAGERDAARAYYLEAARADLNIRESRRLVPLMLMKYLQTSVVSVLALRLEFDELRAAARSATTKERKSPAKSDEDLSVLLRGNWNLQHLLADFLKRQYLEPGFLVDHCVELCRLNPEVWKFFIGLEGVRPLRSELSAFMTESLLSKFSSDELPAFRHLDWESLVEELADRRRAAFSDATGYLFEIESHGTTWTNLLDLRLQFTELAGSISGVCDTDHHFIALLTDAYEQLCEVRPQAEARQGARDLLTRLDALATAYPTPIGLEIRRIVWKWKRTLLGESAGVIQRDSARIGVALGAPWATVVGDQLRLCVRVQNSSISETAERASVHVVVGQTQETGGKLDVHSLAPNTARFAHVDVAAPPMGNDVIDLEFVATWYSGGRTTPITNTYKAHQVRMGAPTKLLRSPWNPEVAATPLFVGRDEILRPIVAGLRNAEGGKNYFILGSTGTGKTNLLTQLKTRLLTLKRESHDVTFLPVFQDWRHDPPLNYAKTTDEFFRMMCRDLQSKARVVAADEFRLTPPDISLDENSAPYVQFRELVANYRDAGFYIVFLWDEFSAFHGSHDSLVARGVLGADFLYMIRALAQQDICRHVLTGHMHLKRLLEDRRLALSGEMRNLETHELTPLSVSEAEQLIRAAEPDLLFSTDAVQSIQSLSANWPKLIQTLCLDCCLLAIDWNLRGVGRHEVEQAVDILLRTQNPPAVGRSEGEYHRWDLNDLQGLIWDQPDLPALHKRVIQTIAEADERGIDVQQLATRLMAKEVPYARIETGLSQALDDLMEPMGPLRHTTNGRYRINVGLFRQWCLVRPVDAGAIVA